MLGPGTRINSFVLDRGTFQLEAVGPDPLRLMEVFKSRGESFENVKLIQIVPLKDSEPGAVPDHGVRPCSVNGRPSCCTS